MAKIDRNKLALGQTIAWLNHGWVEGVVAEVVVCAAKIMYLARPGYGLESFGGASHSTGWKHSLVGADCIYSLGVGAAPEALTDPNPEYAYGDAKYFLKGELKLPEVVPQDRDMFAEWKEQGRKDKVCVESPDEADARIARELAGTKDVQAARTTGRTRTRTFPGNDTAPVSDKDKPADVGMTATHFPAGMKHSYDLPAAPRTRQRARVAAPVPETQPVAPTPPAPRQRVRTR